MYFTLYRDTLKKYHFDYYISCLVSFFQEISFVYLKEFDYNKYRYSPFVSFK